MVWFQCEDCGENLKKPKLPNHFRICSASTWSCIDCNEIFGQQSVQSHTQCISEAEKYGPKGQAKAPNGNTATPKIDAKQRAEVDINVGLSERPPWFCSLCNTKATSKQALLLHAEGKKHRAKARAFHAANQPPKEGNEPTLNANISMENNQKNELPSDADNAGTEREKPSAVAFINDTPKVVNENSQLSKKRKIKASETGTNGKMVRGDSPVELGNGEVIQIERADHGKTKEKLKKAKYSSREENNAVVEPTSPKKDAMKKIKWKKLIKSSLKSRPEGFLKVKKLRKLVLEAVRQSGCTEDESQIADMLEQKIKSSSRFTLDGKYVHLVSKQ